MLKIILSLFCLLFILSSDALAKASTMCHATPKVSDLMPLPEFANSNNLRRLTGSIYTARGMPIVIIGKVVDLNCVPIQNAVINIWQKNANGVYNFDIKQRRLWDKNFSSTGTATTDNNGTFRVVTILPGGKSPAINFLVKHADFPTLETKFHFAGARSSHKHYHYGKGRNADPLLATKMKECGECVCSKDICYYQLQIVLNGENKYHR